MQGVNKVRELTLPAAVSDVMFSKSPCCCNKETPSVPQRLHIEISFYSVVKDPAPAHMELSLDGVHAGIFNQTPYSGL